MIVRIQNGRTILQKDIAEIPPIKTIARGFVAGFFFALAKDENDSLNRSASATVVQEY